MQSFAVPFIHFHEHCTVISSPETRPFIWQTLEIEMNRSGGINSFFTLRPRHPDQSFQYHPGSAIREAGRNAGVLISKYMVGIIEHALWKNQIPASEDLRKHEGPERG